MSRGAGVRDWGIALGVGSTLLGGVFYATVFLGSHTQSRVAEGQIVRKEWTDQRETQVTVGRAGLQTRTISGDGLFVVQVPAPGGQEFRVPVDEKTFHERKVGDPFVFLRP